MYIMVINKAQIEHDGEDTKRALFRYLDMSHNIPFATLVLLNTNARNKVFAIIRQEFILS